MKAYWYRLIVIFLLACFLREANAEHAVLMVYHRGSDWGPVRRLQRELGMQVAAASHKELTWELIRQFNVVLLFDMGRVDEDAVATIGQRFTTEDHAAIGDLLERFVKAGGGVYVYSVSFEHMGNGTAAESLNRFLRRFDAQAPFERLQDPANEVRQPGGRQVLYARASRIVDHPVTDGVDALWYAIGPFTYGPWLRPLVLGAPWTPLIFTSSGYASQPLENSSGRPAPVDAPSVISGERACVFAVREYGKGRIVLYGGESTTSFFGYGYSDYADEEWQRIHMERGLNNIPSDGWRLFVNSLNWLGEPSQKSGELGGFHAPPAEPQDARVAAPMLWREPSANQGRISWQPGFIAVIDPARVGEFVQSARARGMSYFVAGCDFEQVEEGSWHRLRDQARALSDEHFVVIPAVMTRDELGNSFITAGPKAWPQPERLSENHPRRLRDQLGYWMLDAGFPMRIVFNLSAGGYPAWLHSAYNTFAVRTWRDGEIVDDATAHFRQVQEQGDNARPVAVHILSSPVALTAAREVTWLRANKPNDLLHQLTVQNYDNGLAYVSTGPRIVQWTLEHGHRQTWTEDYVPGRERWRLRLAVESETPLMQVTIFDSVRPIRRFAIKGTSANLVVDGLHDTRRVLSAVIEDVDGNRAVTDALSSSDGRFRQSFCSDRCNLMGGSSYIRKRDGTLERVHASTTLCKAGRLGVSTVGEGEELPGIDGSGGGTLFSLAAVLNLSAGEPELTEVRSILHRIERPWESADGLIYHTPILKRSSTRQHDIFGHRPYVPLAEPRHQATLTQHHYYRSPMYPSPALARFAITASEDVTTTAGWNNFHVQFASSWGAIADWVLMRRDGSVQRAPEGADKSWRGRLEPGDSIYFPELGEGLFVRDGYADVVMPCVPEKKWFRLYLGVREQVSLKAGETLSLETILVRVRHDGEQGMEEWRRFGTLYGLMGEPGYQAEVQLGETLDTRYLYTARAENKRFAATFRGDLPQRLPVVVHGLDPASTAGLIDNKRRLWIPLAVVDGVARTTLAVDGEAREILIANLLESDNPNLTLTLLPGNAAGSLRAAVHNSTRTAIRATLRVPVTTWLAPAQSQTMLVPPMSTLGILLQPHQSEIVP